MCGTLPFPIGIQQHYLVLVLVGVGVLVLVLVLDLDLDLDHRTPATLAAIADPGNSNSCPDCSSYVPEVG
jgi:hypothetical protein